MTSMISDLMRSEIITVTVYFALPGVCATTDAPVRTRLNFLCHAKRPSGECSCAGKVHG